MILLAIITQAHIIDVPLHFCSAENQFLHERSVSQASLILSQIIFLHQLRVHVYHTNI